jgi:hypothetical protein
MTTSKKMEDNWKKNERRPQKNKMEDNLQRKMEDDLKNEMKDEPINQNQPNWL